MIGIICEKSFGFSKKGMCCNCGNKHTKEIAVTGRRSLYVKLCNECYKELKEAIASFPE